MIENEQKVLNLRNLCVEHEKLASTLIQRHTNKDLCKFNTKYADDMAQLGILQLSLSLQTRAKFLWKHSTTYYVSCSVRDYRFQHDLIPCGQIFFNDNELSWDVN
jgi:hypothetical protein